MEAPPWRSGAQEVEGRSSGARAIEPLHPVEEVSRHRCPNFGRARDVVVGVPLGRPTGERGFPSETPGAAFSECAGEMGADLLSPVSAGRARRTVCPGLRVAWPFFFVASKFRGSSRGRKWRTHDAAAPVPSPNAPPKCSCFGNAVRDSMLP